MPAAHADVLESLAAFHTAQRSHTEAAAMLAKAVDLRRDALAIADDALPLAQALEQLSEAQSRVGEKEEAATAAEGALALRRAEGLALAPALEALARVASSAGKLDDARTNLLAALADRRERDDSPANIAMTMVRLAQLAARAGDPATAEPYFAEAVEYSRATDAPPLARSEPLFHWGRFLLAQGRPDDAVAVLQEALEIVEAELPAWHYARLAILHSYAWALAADGQPDAAVELLETTRAGLVDLLGPEHEVAAGITAGLDQLRARRDQGDGASDGVHDPAGD
jgi:tetratricopeptide (TPR) repeat protein